MTKNQIVEATRYFLQEGISVQGSKDPEDMNSLLDDGETVKNVMIALLESLPTAVLKRLCTGQKLNFDYGKDA